MVSVWHLGHGTMAVASAAVSQPSTSPSLPVRIAAFVAILVAGTCGGLVGYAVTDLQCADGCTALAGGIGLAGALAAASGVAIVVVLSLRAMAAWQPGQRQQAARDHHPVD